MTRKLIKTSGLIALSIVLAVTARAAGSARLQIPPNSDPIFADDEIIAVRLEAPFAELFSKRSDGFFEAKKIWIEGRLFVGGREIPVRLRMRGFSTLSTLCSFPKLMLKIDKEASSGTLFEGITKIDLGTHCLSEAEAKIKNVDGLRFPHREALLYRWAKILEIPTFATRPVSVTYTDTSRVSPLPNITRPGFFLEHLSSLKRRAKAVEIRPVNDTLHPESELGSKDSIKLEWRSPEESVSLDRDHLARVALFESLIGNGDWRMNSKELWNVKVLELPSQQWLTIPMDFNFSSIALGYPSAEPNWTYEGFVNWPLAGKKTRLEIIEEFESRRPALVKSVELLKNEDPVGYRVAMESLNARFASIAKLKEELLSD